MGDDMFYKQALDIIKQAGVREWKHVPNWNSSHSYPEIATIFTPHPTQDQHVGVVAHEAGHVATSAPLFYRGASLITIELAASLWARDTMRDTGMEITRGHKDAWAYGLWSYLGNYATGQRQLVNDIRRDGIRETLTTFLKELEA